MNNRELLKTAITAATRATEDILEVYEMNFSVDLKEDRTPLTEADRRSHNAITALLKETALPVLSEEGRNVPFEERNKWDRFWLVDPLDGTKEFVKRNGEFTVNICLVDKGIPVMGVILVPVTGELYFSSPETGARKKTIATGGILDIEDILENNRILPLETGGRPYTVVCSRSHPSERTREHVEKLKQEHPGLDFVSKGSSLKLCLVAEGRADEYPRFAPTMEWDTAAGQSIVESSGGRVIRVDDGRTLTYNKPDLLNPWFIALRP